MDLQNNSNVYQTEQKCVKSVPVLEYLTLMSSATKRATFPFTKRIIKGW